MPTEVAGPTAEARRRAASKLVEVVMDCADPHCLADFWSQALGYEIVEDERRTLSFRAEDDARLREQFLDSIPADPAGQLRELRDENCALVTVAGE